MHTASDSKAFFLFQHAAKHGGQEHLLTARVALQRQ